MGDSTVDYIYFEATTPLTLPRYLRKTKFGIDRQAVTGNQAPYLTKIPRRAHGTLEVANWPKFSKVGDSAELENLQNAFEDLPSKLVPCPDCNSRKSLLRPVNNTQVSIGKPSSVVRYFVGNRHIPQDSSVYYVEMEGEALESACIGLVNMRVRYAEQHWAKYSSNAAQRADDIPSAPQGNTTAMPPRPSGQDALDGAHEEPDTEDVLMRTSPSGAAQEESSSSEGSFIADMSDEEEANSSNGDDDFASDEDEYLEGTDYADDSDEEEVDDHNEDDSNLAESEDEERHEGETAIRHASNQQLQEVLHPYPPVVEGSAGPFRENGVPVGSARYKGSRCTISFPSLAATYNFKFRNSTMSDISITRHSGRDVSPYCSWNLENGSLQIGDIMFSSAKRADLILRQAGYRKKQRIGMLIDFLHQKIKFTLNGVLIDQELDMPEEPALDCDRSNTQYFPFFGLKKGNLEVIFGNGNLENDGFAFDISGYTSNLHEALPETKNLAGSTESLVYEYLKAYGYTETLGSAATESMSNRGQIRKLIENRDMDGLNALLQNADLSQDTRFFLDLAAFVDAARRYSDEFLAQNRANWSNDMVAASDSHLARTLEMGRHLLKAAENDPVKQNLVRESSGILITEEPRATNFTQHYDDMAKKRLMSRILADLEPGVRTPMVEIFSDKVKALATKAPLGNRLAAQAVASLHDVSGEDYFH